MSVGFFTIGAAAISLGALIGAPAAAPQAQALPPLVVFQSDRDGDEDIYVMNPDGTNQRPLTRNRVGDAVPSWSPDGTKIVFASNRAGNWELYTMDASGKNVVRLTYDKAGEFDPVFAPDGESIAFESDRTRNWDVWKMPVKPRAQGVNLTNAPTDEFDPSWSPDSKSVAFSTGGDGVSVIAAVDVSSPGQIRRITHGEARDNDPGWTPDNEIVFTRVTGANRDIFAMTADGTDVRPLTSGIGDDWGPVASTSGRVFFVRERTNDQIGPSAQIVSMNAQGGDQQRLTKPARYVDAEPAPRPNSKIVTFERAPTASRSMARALACTTFSGNDFPNTIIKDAGCQIIYGNGGNDVLKSGADNDYIYAGSGNDHTVHGGSGADRVYGQSGNDSKVAATDTGVDGGDGDDPVVFGGTGNDYLNGGNGNDTLFADGDGVKDTGTGGFGTDDAYIDEYVDVISSAALH